MLLICICLYSLENPASVFQVELHKPIQMLLPARHQPNCMDTNLWITHIWSRFDNKGISSALWQEVAGWVGRLPEGKKSRKRTTEKDGIYKQNILDLF